MIRNQEAYDLIIAARVKLLRLKPFFGSLVMNLKIVEMDEIQCKSINTACTDGRRILYNPDYITELNNMDFEYVQTLLVHEVFHCAFSHINRRKGRLANVWNYATDYWINGYIGDPKMDHKFLIKSDWLYDEKYAGLSSDEIYNILIEDMRNNPNSGLNSGMGIDGKGLVDHHIDEMEDSKEDCNDGKSLEQFWKDNLASAYFNASRAGLGSGGLSKYLGQLFDPKIKWYDRIRKSIEQHTQTDYTWKKPNRRMFSTGIILPSMDNEAEVKLAIAVDTSGSIFHEIEAFFSEIKGIVNTYPKYTIYIACFDGEVKKPFIIRSEADFNEYIHMIEGGGGTNFISWWNWFYDEKINEKVDTVIFFTDMEPCGAFVRDDHNFDNLYWVAKNSNKIAPVGETLIYD